MKSLFFLFGICALLPTALNAQQSLGQYHVCTPAGDHTFYEKYANLSLEIDEEGFTSALSVVYSRRDERIVGMISDIGLSAKPGGFKLVIEYYPKSANKVQAKNRLLYNDIANLNGDFNTYRKRQGNSQTTYLPTNPDDPWFVFFNENSDDENPSENSLVAECYKIARPYASYCRIERFINDSIRLNFRFPAVDYTRGNLIFNYVKRYVNSEIFRQKNDGCRFD